MPGYLYLATNPVMPGLTKIGFSETVLSERFAALQSTGVPVPFELFAAFYVEDPRSCEKAVHGAFVSERVRENREFFRIAAKEALGRVLPLVLANVPDSTNEGQPPAQLFGDLDEQEQDVLAAYAMAPSYQRPHDWEWLARVFRMSELDSRHLFHSLRTKGYLREDRSRGSVIFYDLTPRGVAFGRVARDNPEYQVRFNKAFYFQDPHR
ncbi:MAG TPA: GIY-YIG nuclease family protein [Opitutaceae bacterium]|nr:GIY-YIG nuclease family protein [Opitutaceae bacterium]